MKHAAVPAHHQRSGFDPKPFAGRYRNPEDSPSDEVSDAQRNTNPTVLVDDCHGQVSAAAMWSIELSATEADGKGWSALLTGLR